MKRGSDTKRAHEAQRRRRADRRCSTSVWSSIARISRRAVLEHGGEERLLGREVLVDDRLGAAGGRGDLARARAVEAVAREQRARDLEDQRAALVGGQALARGPAESVGGCDSHPRQTSECSLTCQAAGPQLELELDRRRAAGRSASSTSGDVQAARRPRASARRDPRGCARRRRAPGCARSIASRSAAEPASSSGAARSQMPSGGPCASRTSSPAGIAAKRTASRRPAP